MEDVYLVVETVPENPARLRGIYRTREAAEARKGQMREQEAAWRLTRIYQLPLNTDFRVSLLFADLRDPPSTD